MRGGVCKGCGGVVCRCVKANCPQMWRWCAVCVGCGSAYVRVKRESVKSCRAAVVARKGAGKERVCCSKSVQRYVKVKVCKVCVPSARVCVRVAVARKCVVMGASNRTRSCPVRHRDRQV